MYRGLAGRCEGPDYARPAARAGAKNITLTTAAAALDVWPSRLGELELSRRRDDDFASDSADGSTRLDNDCTRQSLLGRVC